MEIQRTGGKSRSALCLSFRGVNDHTTGGRAGSEWKEHLVVNPGLPISLQFGCFTFLNYSCIIFKWKIASILWDCHEVRQGQKIKTLSILHGEKRSLINIC